MPAVLLGVLIVYLAFHAGGYFPGTTGFAAVLVAIALAVRLFIARQPAAGLTSALAVAAAALALYGVWTLLSATWSHAPGRALIEFDRALLYLLVLLVFGLEAGARGRARWLVRALAVAFGVVATAGLVTRLLPDLWPIAPNFANDRLSYPLTYWNALGLLAGIGLVLCLQIASSRGERRLVRSVAAAGVPVLATTVFFTFSRGAIAATVVGVLAYLVAARSPRLVGTLLAVVPTTAVVVTAAYGAELLATFDPTTPAATEQGHRIAWIVATSALAAGVLRGVLAPLDERLARVRLSRRVRRPVLATTTAVVLAILAVTVIAADVPDFVASQYDRFVRGDQVVPADLRSRLTDPGNNQRLQMWRVALRGVDEDRARGTGAGTYEPTWYRLRDDPVIVRDAHSLYLETLSDSGVVGLLLLTTTVAVLLVGLAARARRRRGPYAALLGAAVMWAFHAGVDWDWEMPAVTLWLFAAGGIALSSRTSAPNRLRPARGVRVAMGLVVLALALVPALLAYSHGRLDDAAAALRRGDCAQAVDASLASIDALDARPEPFEVLGYCDLRAGASRLAVGAMSAAVARDPEHWRPRYGLAVARAAAGMDPRPAARAALRLNPKDVWTRLLVLRVDADTSRAWRARARRLPIPLPRP